MTIKKLFALGVLSLPLMTLSQISSASCTVSYVNGDVAHKLDCTSSAASEDGFEVTIDGFAAGAYPNGFFLRGSVFNEEQASDQYLTITAKGSSDPKNGYCKAMITETGAAVGDTLNTISKNVEKLGIGGRRICEAEVTLDAWRLGEGPGFVRSLYKPVSVKIRVEADFLRAGE